VSMTERTKMGRMALRVEGDNWVAYYAEPDTMEGALFLASIKMRLVQNKERKAQFMTLVRAIVGDLIEEALGERPSFSRPKTVPPHERSGNA
jgi:hypothetical protein